MKSVKAQLVVYKEQYEQTGGHAQGQTKDVDE